MLFGNESTERPVSPVFVSGGKLPQLCRNGLQEDSGIVKIRRIPLYRTAVVEVLKAESPSCIWVRLTNHITDNLILTEPADLVPRCRSDGISDVVPLKEFEYCLAPIRDRIYGRCRILEVHDDTVKVFFIDEGVEAWLIKDCLAYMPRDFSYHPWQAIMISLCGVTTRPRCIPFQDPQLWTLEECVSFRRVLNSFQLFKTRTVKSSIIYNDYRKPIMVEMYGIPEGYSDTSPETGISIASLFAAERYNRVINRRIADAASFTPLLSYMEPKDIPDLEDIRPFRRSFPIDWKRNSTMNDHLLCNEIAIEWHKWSPQVARVPPIEVEWLNDHGYCTMGGEYLVNIEGSQTQSPYEFYARPIKRERLCSTKCTSNGSIDLEAGDQLQLESDAMLSANDELRKKASVLDAFYSLEENRCPIDKNQCASWLKDGVRVFAICACSEERGTYTGEWQRVEILSCNEFASVLYLDSGGTELVLPHSLFKIHPSHCTYPAMCMQMCMFGVVPSTATKELVWSDGSKTLWKRLLREDLPIIVSLLKRLNSADDNRVLPAGKPPWCRPGVMFVQFMKVYGDTTSIMEKFCSISKSPDNGVFCDDAPRPWIYD